MSSERGKRLGNIQAIFEAIRQLREEGGSGNRREILTRAEEIIHQRGEQAEDRVISLLQTSVKSIQIKKAAPWEDRKLKTDAWISLEGIEGHIPLQIKASEVGRRNFLRENPNFKGIVLIYEDSADELVQDFYRQLEDIQN